MNLINVIAFSLSIFYVSYPKKKNLLDLPSVSYVFGYVFAIMDLFKLSLYISLWWVMLVLAKNI